MSVSERLAYFLDHSSSIYYITTDVKGHYTYINRLFSQIFISDESVILGKAFCSDIFDEDVELCTEAMNDCLEKPGETCSVDLRKLRNDGSMFWTRWEFCALLTKENTVAGIHGIGNDITERKRAESENQKAQENLRLLLDNTEESFIMIDSKLEIISFNLSADRRMLQFFGKHLRKGFSIFDYVTTPVEEMKKMYAEILQGHERETELELNLKGKKLIYFNHFKPIYNNDGQVFAIIITSRDVTENKLAAEKLEQNEKHFRSLIENSADAVTILSQEGEVFDISPSAERILGHPKERMRNGNPSELIHPDDLALISDTFAEVVEKKDSIKTIEYRALAADGKYKWLAGTYHNLLYEPSINGIVLNFSDITQRKKAEQALQESEEKYRILFYMNPQPMWIYDIKSLDFLEVNEAAIRNYGYSKEEFLTMKITDIRPDTDVKKLYDQLDMLKLNGKIIRDSVWGHRKKNGKVIMVEIKSNTIEYNNREAKLVLATDITEQLQAQEKLLISNQRFEFAAKATSDAIWEWDIVRDSMYMSDTYKDIFGWDISKQRKFKEWTDYIHPDDIHVAENFYSTVEDSGKDLWESEYRYLKADGNFAYVADRGYILRDKKGIAVKVVGAIRDITERKEAEEKLSREKYLLRTLIDHLPDYIYVKDVEYKHVINNKANVELIGASTEEETLGKTVVDYFGEVAAERYMEHDREVMREGKAINNLEEAIPGPDGKYRWLLTTKVPLKNEQNKVVGLVGISRDITERKLIEESLRVSHERYNMAIRATNDAIWDADLKNNTLNWGGGFETLFGYALEKIGNDPASWVDHIHPEDKEKVLERHYAVIRDTKDSSWIDEYRFIRADGSIANVIDRGLILRDEKGIAYRMVGAMMDITERKQLEAQLAEQRINRQRQITEAAIQAQEKERGEIGRELHDNINQILTTTKLYIDMAINEKDIREELLKKSHANVSTAIEEIRVLSKSLVPPTLGDIGIREALTEMISNLNLAQKLQIKLKTSGFSNVVIDDSIKLMVFRIVQEQLNNIIKHSKATEANIKLAVSKKVLNITIADNGIGFDTKKKMKGIGLGNITSRAELHDGEVLIESSPGNGCILTINIPI
ncbi:MAG TPA: PAS domain S-box protein [Flavitalea sp.]|nr:PAS domain S-box protein [Flavitalea sp.]